MDIDKKLTEKYHFEVCEKHPNIVWANISRWSSECPLCELEADWEYNVKQVENERDELDTELEESKERVGELENTLDDTQRALDDITTTLNQL